MPRWTLTDDARAAYRRTMALPRDADVEAEIRDLCEGARQRPSGAWRAAKRHHDLQLTVECNGPDPVLSDVRPPSESWTPPRRPAGLTQEQVRRLPGIARRLDDAAGRAAGAKSRLDIERLRDTARELAEDLAAMLGRA